MSLPRTYSLNARPVGLPIDGNIDYATPGPDDPQGRWPPLSVSARIERLSWFTDSYLGDFTHLTDDYVDTQNQTRPVFRRDNGSPYTVQFNPFRLVPSAIADILMMTPPEFDDPLLSTNVGGTLYKICLLYTSPSPRDS